MTNENENSDPFDVYGFEGEEELLKAVAEEIRKREALEAEHRRKAFLDSLEPTGCGQAKPNCDGSEGTCTCQ